MDQSTLKSLIEAVPLPVLVIGGKQTVVATNAALDTLLGGQFAGRHYITALRQPALLDQIETVMRDGGQARARYLGRDGQRDITYDVRIAQSEAGVVLTFIDMTAARDVGRFRRDFVANVSHELRTPLTAISGFVETLRGAARNDPAARDRFLEIMGRESERMMRLVDDLLSLSRVEEDERRRPTTPVALGPLLASTASELEPVTGAAGVTLEIMDQSQEQTVPGDPGQLRQVIGNLIENAVKYGGEGQEVKITLSAPSPEPRLRGTGIRLSVQDKGPGIAEHHIPRLTERFYRVDDHRSREIGGTGLGLAIVKHIVNRHRGRLIIESEQGLGTTVTVVLPTT